MTNLLSTIKDKCISERVLLALSFLLFVFVTPPTIIRFVEQNWVMVLVDCFILGNAAFIFYNTLRDRFISFLKYYMCTIVCVGVSMSVMFGGMEVIYWIYPTILTAFLLVKAKYALMYLLFICICIGPTVISSVSAMEALTIYFALFGSAGFINVFSSELTSENRSLNKLASIDPLTGIKNRREFEQQAYKAIADCDSKLSTALIIIDIDDFKILNDNFGHVIGDKVLQQFSEIVSNRLPKDSAVYRLGGEEFAIMMSKADLKAAMDLAERVKSAIEINPDDHLPKYTVSMGVAVLKAGEKLHEWTERADQAMYYSKRNGKNQVSAEMPNIQIRKSDASNSA